MNAARASGVWLQGLLQCLGRDPVGHAQLLVVLGGDPAGRAPAEDQAVHQAGVRVALDHDLAPGAGPAPGTGRGFPGSRRWSKTRPALHRRPRRPAARPAHKAWATGPGRCPRCPGGHPGAERGLPARTAGPGRLPPLPCAPERESGWSPESRTRSPPRGRARWAARRTLRAVRAMGPWRPRDRNRRARRSLGHLVQIGAGEPVQVAVQDAVRHRPSQSRCDGPWPSCRDAGRRSGSGSRS